MAIDVSRHLLDSLEEEDITAHERRVPGGGECDEMG